MGCKINPYLDRVDVILKNLGLSKGIAMNTSCHISIFYQFIVILIIEDEAMRYK